MATVDVPAPIPPQRRFGRAILRLLMLDEAELITIADSLAILTTSPAAVDALLGGGHAARIVVHQQPFVYTMAVLRYCNRPSSWEQHPPLMKRLLLALKTDPFIKQILDEIDHPPDPSKMARLEKEFDVWLLQRGRVLIARGELKKAFEALHEDELRTLLVSGFPVSGKTYSRHYVSYMLKKLKAGKVADVGLKSAASVPDYGPDELARDLLLKLTRGDSVKLPEKASRVERWVEELYREVYRAIKKVKKTCWLILDGFGDKDLPDATHKLIEKLIMLAENDDEPVRLILADYPLDRIPLAVLPDIEKEPLEKINRTEIEDFFTRAFGEMKWPIEQLGASVDAVWAKVRDDDPRRLETLGREVEREVARLMEG